MLFDISTRGLRFKVISFIKELSICHLNLILSVLESLSMSLVDPFTWQMPSCTLSSTEGCTAAERHLRCEFVIWSHGLEFPFCPSHERSLHDPDWCSPHTEANSTLKFKHLTPSPPPRLCVHTSLSRFLWKNNWIFKIQRVSRFKTLQCWLGFKKTTSVINSNHVYKWLLPWW